VGREEELKHKKGWEGTFRTQGGLVIYEKEKYFTMQG